MVNVPAPLSSPKAVPSESSNGRFERLVGFSLSGVINSVRSCFVRSQREEMSGPPLPPNVEKGMQNLARYMEHNLGPYHNQHRSRLVLDHAFRSWSRAAMDKMLVRFRSEFLETGFADEVEFDVWFMYQCSAWTPAFDPSDMTATELVARDTQDLYAREKAALEKRKLEKKKQTQAEGNQSEVPRSDETEEAPDVLPFTPAQRSA